MFEIPTSQDSKLPAASNPQLPPSSNQRSRPANEGDFPLGGIHPLGQLHLCRCCPGNPDSDAGESREEISHGGCFVETALFLAVSFHFLKHTFLSILSYLKFFDHQVCPIFSSPICYIKTVEFFRDQFCIKKCCRSPDLFGPPFPHRSPFSACANVPADWLPSNPSIPCQAQSKA